MGQDSIAAAASSGPDPIHFIVSNSWEKPSGDDRKLIRRHVMRGKNKTTAAARKKKHVPGSWIDLQADSPADCRTVDASKEILAHRIDAERLAYLIPRTLGKDIDFVPFAIDMEPYMLELVQNCSLIVKEFLYPVVLCKLFDKSFWNVHFREDRAYVHCTLFTTQIYLDTLRGKPLSPVTTKHLTHTLHSLQENINKTELATRDSTISVVISLTLGALFMGDTQTAKKHMLGLYKIVELRGGIWSIKQRDLQIKVCRADLSVALTTSTKPLFFADTKYDTYLAKPKSPKTKQLPNRIAIAACPSKDYRLVNVWLDLQEFTKSICVAFATGSKLDSSLFQQSMVSVQYRLLYLGPLVGSLDETLRLGMLALSTTFFRTRGSQIGCVALLEAFSTSLQRVNYLASADRRQQELMLWLCCICGILASALTTQEPGEEGWAPAQFTRSLQSLGLESWETVKAVLEKHMWIDQLHSVAGKQVFEEATETTVVNPS